MGEKIKLTWLGHSCFKLEYGDYSLVVDPYEDGTVPGLEPLRVKANAVFCSHDHYDHNYTRAVETVPYAGKAPLSVREVESTHDDAGGAERGMNTIFVFEAGGIRAVHMGDIGAAPTARQLAVIGRPDVLMIPVGGFFTIGPEAAKEWAEKLGAGVVIPMHYRLGGMGFDVIGTLDDYLRLCVDVTRYDGSSIEIDKDTPKQTAVLKVG